MTDQDRFPSSENPAANEPEASASSVFLEMMRQQASRTAPHPDLAPQVVSAPAPATPIPLPEAEAPTPAATPAPAPRRPARAQRRRIRQKGRTESVFGGALRTLFITTLTGLLVATVFTWITSPDRLSPTVRGNLSSAMATATQQGVFIQPTSAPITPNWLRRIGIVSGHRGPNNDPGAVCPDGLTEAEINLNVAQGVARNLQGRGYTVDLLDEFDPRLADYNAELLLSIHANTCQDYGEVVSGFLISTADARIGSGNDELLVECVAVNYAQSVPLDRRFGLTRDMTDYHIFREISPRTPAAILELGFMFSDREVLIRDPDLLAQAITSGLLCFLEPTHPNMLATLTAPTPNPILPTAEPTFTPFVFDPPTPSQETATP